MQPETKILLDSYKKQFTNYLTYIKSNNWVFDNSDDSVIEKYTTENSLVSGVLNTLSKFKEDIQEDIELKPIQSFFEFSFNIVAIHINRVEDYLNENDWSKMFDIRISDINRLLQDYDDVSSKSDEDKEYIQQLKTDLKDIEGDKRKEIQFQNTLFQNITAHKVKKSKLKLDKDDIQRGSTELFFGDDNKAGKYVKAPLLMRKMLCDNIPLVKQKTELLELDFHAPSMNPTTSNEMLINMNPKDIPQWDTKKHFFEQEISTIQFWEEEIRKIKNGINIGGYFIHPFLYWLVLLF